MKGLWDLIQNLIRDQVIEECAKEIEANAGGSQRSRRLARNGRILRLLRPSCSQSQGLQMSEPTLEWKAIPSHVAEGSARVIRFTGSEIYADPCKCASEALQLADELFWAWFETKNGGL